MAQHSLKQLIFSLVLFYDLFSFAQEENVTLFYVSPNTSIIGLDYLNLNTKLVKQEKEQTHLYIVENTIFYSSNDLAIVTIKDNYDIYTATQRKENKVIHKYVVKTNEQVVKAQSKTQITRTSFPFSLPIKQKQTIFTVILTTTVTPSTFSKTVSKTFTILNCFSLPIRKVLSKKQYTICYNKNSKPFQVKIKHCNRPPPRSYC